MVHDVATVCYMPSLQEPLSWSAWCNALSILMQAVLFGAGQSGNQTAALITLGQPQYDNATQVSWGTLSSHMLQAEFKVLQ